MGRRVNVGTTTDKKLTQKSREDENQRRATAQVYASGKRNLDRFYAGDRFKRVSGVEESDQTAATAPNPPSGAAGESGGSDVTSPAAVAAKGAAQRAEKAAEVWDRVSRGGMAPVAALVPREVRAPSYVPLDGTGVLMAARYADEADAPQQLGGVLRAPASNETPELSAEDRARHAQICAEVARKEARRAANERRWTAYWRDICEMDRAKRPPLVDPDTWAICRATVVSPSACAEALRLIGNNYGGAVLGRVSRAAFGCGRWDTTHLTARRVVALCLYMLRSARPKAWGGHDAIGRSLFQGCVWGHGVPLLCALLADPYSGTPLSCERLTHSKERHSDGLFKRCADAGVFVRQRVPFEVAWNDEIGPTGYTFNRYWVCSIWNTKPALKHDDERDPFAASEAGWECVDHGTWAVPRGRYRLGIAFLLSDIGARWLRRRMGVDDDDEPPN